MRVANVSMRKNESLQRHGKIKLFSKSMIYFKRYRNSDFNFRLLNDHANFYLYFVENKAIMSQTTTEAEGNPNEVIVFSRAWNRSSGTISHKHMYISITRALKHFNLSVCIEY